MNNFIKKSFLISMVALTALWGVAFVVTPASANVAMAGDLIKSSSSPAVYYLDSNNVRHPFHHEREYSTWYSGFSGVKTIPTDEMVGYTLGTTVVVRPGSRLVQYVEVLGDGTWNVSNTPQVYAAGANGALHLLTSAADAVALYGSNWESKIIPLPNYLSANYSTGTALTSSSMYPTGTLVKTSSSAQIYYVDGSTKRPVTDAGLTANRFNMNYVVTASSLSGYTDGASITAMESAIANPVAGTGSTTTPTTGTGLTVALATDTPGAQVAPIAATSVTLMNFNVTAGSDGAVTISQINMQQRGAGDANDFAYFYLYDGATRLTNGRTMNSTTRVIQFTTLNYSVPAGTTKALSLVGDVATSAGGATSGGLHYFTIESGAVSTTATVSGSFPIASNTVTIGSVSAGTVTINKNGSLTNPVVGEVDAKVAQLKLTAGSGEDVSIRRVTFYQGGSINNAYLSNLKLLQGTTQLATVASVTSKGLVVFDLSSAPYILAKNTNRIFQVSATVSGAARNNDTTKIYLENNADLYAVGTTYGYGAAVDSDDSDGYDGSDSSCTSQTTCADSTYLVVQGGQLTVAKKGPQSTSYAKGVTGVTMMNFSVAAGVNAEIRKLRVEVHNDAAAGSDIGATAATDASTSDSCALDYIANVKIVDTDNGESTTAVNCSGFTNIDSADGVYYDYTDYFNINAGQTRNFAIKLDLTSSVDADDYYVVLGRSGTRYAASVTDIYTIGTTDGAKNLDNNQWITDIVPTTNTTGNEMTVAAASVGVALASNPVANTVVQGSNNVNLGEFAFNAGAGSPITITSMTFTGYIASTSPTGNNSVKAAGCSAAQAGNTYCINMGGDLFSYVSNIGTNLRLYNVSDDPSMTTNLNATSEGIVSSDGTVAFSNMNWTIPSSQTKTLRLVGNISNTSYNDGAAGNKHIKFNIAAAANVSAQNSEGGSVTLTDNDGTAFAITDVNGAATTMSSSYYLTVTNAGTMTATTESNPATANIRAGALMVPMLNVKFLATNEAFNVNKLRIKEVQNTASNSRAVDNVVISYKNQANATVTNTMGLTDSIADYDITANPMYVPKNMSKVVNVYYNTNAIDSTNATYTGDQMRVAFFPNNNFEAKSAGDGSTTLTTATTGATSSVMTLHGSLPTFTAETTSGALSNAAVDLYKVKVTATEGGTDVTLKKLPFTLAFTDTVFANGLAQVASLTLTNFQVWEGDSYDNATHDSGWQADTGASSYAVYNGYGATLTAATYNATTGAFGAGGKISAATGVLASDVKNGAGLITSASSSWNVIVVFNDDRLIPAGGSRYFILKATGGGVNTGNNSNDSITTALYNGDTSTTGAAFITASCDFEGSAAAGQTSNGVQGETKYCLSTVSAAASGVGNQIVSWMIWSDATGTNGNNAHQDVNGELTYDGASVTVSKDWFNGYNIKTLGQPRAIE